MFGRSNLQQLCPPLHLGESDGTQIREDEMYKGTDATRGKWLWGPVDEKTRVQGEYRWGGADM